MVRLTEEEVLNNYQYIVTVKLIKRQFPWIKSVGIRKGEDVNKYSIIFLDAVIDPWQLAKEKDLQVIWFIENYLNSGYFSQNEFWSPFLSVYYEGNPSGARESAEEIKRVIDRVDINPAIPTEYKLPRGRSFDIGSWYLWKDSIVIPEYTAEQKK